MGNSSIRWVIIQAVGLVLTVKGLKVEFWPQGSGTCLNLVSIVIAD